MSDIKDRLRALRKKKKQTRDQSDTSKSDSEREKTLDKLRSLISSVENKPKSDLNSDHLSGIDLQISSSIDELPPGNEQDIEDIIPGEFIDTDSGQCFRVKTVYPWQYHQGDVSLSDLLDLDPAGFRRLIEDEKIAGVNFHKMIFFDTETTGLDTGAGTYIFLAGLGYFREREFVVEQFFMRDFPEEPAVLTAICDLMSKFEAVVSYNGRTYDWPLLETRFVVNRMKMPIQDPIHIDLLTLSRRLYRHRLENCSLISVEEGVLNFKRVDDLPGMLMPDLYFQYVRSRDARHIHKAFSHNAHDIVSMAAVMVKMLNFSANPLNTSEHPAHDVYAYGRIAENSERFDDAITAYRKSLEAGLFAPARTDAIVRLSMILKRTDRWKEALKLWEQLKDTSHSHDIFPYEEIAKYCEHQLKDYNAALKVVNDALKQLDFTEYMGECRQQSLLHRKRRLEARRDGRSWRFKKNERSD